VRHRRIALELLAIILLFCGGFSFAHFSRPEKKLATATEVPLSPSVSSEKKPDSIVATGNYLANGTIFWGRGIEKWSRGDTSWPFQKLSSFSPEKYDAWIADLECPVTSNLISFERQVADLVFNCDPKFLPEAAKHFQFMNLANNHSGDQGYDGFLETRKRLLTANVQAFGNYDPSVEKDRCEVVALPVRTSTQEKKLLPAAFCSWHYFFRTPQAGEIETLKEYAMRMPVFAFVHMGTEYAATANDTQTTIARKLVDAGASLVIANNPHWVQNSESYKGKLIVYSTGNFIFDQLDTETRRSVSIDIKMDAVGDLTPWFALASQCSAFQDDCLKQAQKDSMKPYEVTLSYDFVAGDASGNNQTRKGDEAMRQILSSRLSWQQTLLSLAKTGGTE
jgi:hypothetical protein